MVIGSLAWMCALSYIMHVQCIAILLLFLKSSVSRKEISLQSSDIKTMDGGKQK
ncbi:SH3 domain-containing protein [Histoplasma capsulatum H143]|uniref:SH3 domain-containing protein n=1 Tax=Ajellomyces capsulatus (strain H143) TaxID=544712 RepID=C6H1G4_AJECH|nr:SH3 domain-containing protein [Histoplasma capsulatum H143]